MSDIQQAVREKYGAIAASVTKASTSTGCCGPTACGCGDPITSNLYSAVETAELPADAVTASLGCGNPTALIDLKPGGRFAVSDVVVRGEVPADVRRSLELWVGCIAGALEETEYAARLRAAGFADVEVEPWRIYKIDDARGFLAESGVDVDRVAPEVDGRFLSAFVRARKPEAKGCCGPDCCA